MPTEFTTQHFDNTMLTLADQVAHEGCSTDLRVRISSFLSDEQVPTSMHENSSLTYEKSTSLDSRQKNSTNRRPWRY